MTVAMTTGVHDHSWRASLPASVRPYAEAGPLAALFLGISSGFPYAMIGATLTTRLAQDGIDKKSVTAFTLAFLVYNLKFLWAWMAVASRLARGSVRPRFSVAAITSTPASSIHETRWPSRPMS